MATAVFFSKGSTLHRCGAYFCCWGVFFLPVSWAAISSEGRPPLKTIFATEIDAVLMMQLKLLIQVNSVLVGPRWSLAHQLHKWLITSGNSSFLFFANGSTLHSCGAYLWLGWCFPYCFLGGEQLWRASPFGNHFAIEIDALLMKQLWSLWFQVVGPWWSLAHK